MWPKKCLTTWQNKPRENDAVVFGNILVNFGPDWGWGATVIEDKRSSLIHSLILVSATKNIVTDRGQSS